jgi:hypothetical protein
MAFWTTRTRQATANTGLCNGGGSYIVYLPQHRDNALSSIWALQDLLPTNQIALACYNAPSQGLAKEANNAILTAPHVANH